MKIEIELTIGLNAAVLALLVSTAGIAAPNLQPVPARDKTAEEIAAASAPKADAAAPAAADVSGDIDAGGHPWSEALHASTKTKTKEGLWRMKVGVSRPDPLPGFPKDTGTGSTGSAASAGSSAGSPPASGAAAAPAADEDDEFAAFRDAMGSTTAAPAAAARKYTDADLGALCNQAAVKLGDPAPVKTLIGDYVPEGTVPHSRNIPDDQRAAFVAAVEAKADITFAG